jgi:CubicO group peptidase (beta-lactamase class C family)
MDAPLSEILQQQLKPAIDQREQEHTFSGTVLVSRNAAPLFAGAWGYASRTWQIKNTLDTLFPTASVTKIFTATAILQLVEAGRLTLDQSVRALMPLQDSTISEAVTVAHLLTHTAGIGDYFLEDEATWPPVFQTTPTYTLRCVADFLPLFIGLPARFPAGTQFAYCNAGYILLGRLIEVLTGADYFTAIRQQIFVPAGMERACFPTVDMVCAQLAEPYTISSDTTGSPHWEKCLSTSIPPASDGGLATSAGELDRYWRALLGGRLLGAALLKSMMTVQVAIREHWAYGLGVYIVRDPRGLPRYEVHGFDPGVNAYMAHDPTLGVNVMVLSNLENAATGVFNQLHALLVDHAAR